MNDQPTYSKPRAGVNYANYERLLLPFDVTVDFWRRFGVAPEEVIFAKPGMWLAGPVPELRREDPPAPELARVETTETAPTLDGQTRFL